MPTSVVLGCRKRLESKHGTGDPLYGSMIRLDKIMQIFHLTDDDVGAILRVVALDGGFIGLTAIKG